MDWTSDGASAHGVVQFVLRDSAGAVSCDGSYDVTYTRQ